MHTLIAGKTVAVFTEDSLQKVIQGVALANPYLANTPEHEAWMKCANSILDKVLNEA